MARPRNIPFWAHQAVEYLLGALLVLVALGMPQSGGLVIAGGALVIVVAAVTDGPLGACSLLGRTAHRAADFVVVAVLATAPLLLHRHEPDVWIVAEAAAAGLAVMARATKYVSPPKAARRRGGAATPSTPITPVVARRVGGVVGRLGKNGPRALGRAVGKRRADRDGGQA